MLIKKLFFNSEKKNHDLGDTLLHYKTKNENRCHPKELLVYLCQMTVMTGLYC